MLHKECNLLISRQEVGSGAFLFTYAKFFWSHLFKKSLKTSKTSPILNGCRTLAVSVVLEINVYLMKNLFFVTEIFLFVKTLNFQS